MAVTSNTGTTTPLVGGEVAVATIAGGPYDSVTAYVQGGDSVDGLGQNLYRLYALVGTTTTLLAETQVLGGPKATILQWQVPRTGAGDSQFVQAGGTSYIVKVLALPTSPLVRNPVLVTLAGVDQFDTVADTNISPTLVVGSFSEVSSANVGGYAQLMDVSVDQTGLPQSTTITIYANNGPGSVEAIVAQLGLPGPDGITVVLRKIVLPIASVYRVSVRNNTGTAISVPIAIATYSVSITSGGVVALAGDVIGPSNANTVVRWDNVPLLLGAAPGFTTPTDAAVPIYDAGLNEWRTFPLSGGATMTDAGVVSIAAGGITSGPQITTLRSVTPTTPTSVVWASTGYVDFVADCGADPTGVADCAHAFDVAFGILSSLGSSPTTATAVRLFFPPGLYSLRSAPTIGTWNFQNKTTNLDVVGAGKDATIIQLNGVDLPILGNCQNVRLADFTLTGATAGNDCVNGWEIAYVYQLAVIERVRM